MALSIDIKINFRKQLFNCLNQLNWFLNIANTKSRLITSNQIKDLAVFALIIFRNLGKSLEYVCNGIAIQQNKYTYDTLYKKEPTPETYSWHFSLQLQ